MLGERATSWAPERVRVLFVEDDPAVAQMYKLKLELDGYEVDVVHDGETALEVARDSPPDIIFLDLRLRRIDGIEVLELLRGDPETGKVPVVILSGDTERELMERGVKLGVLDHVIRCKATPASVAYGVEKRLKP